MSIESIQVSSIMTKDVRKAKESQTIRAVASAMVDYGIGSMIIVKDTDVQSPVGILTERDIVRLVGRPKLSFAAQVSEVMKKPLITADPKASIRDAMQIMQQKNIRRLPIVENGKLVGIVTDKDIFKALLKSQTLITDMITDTVIFEYKPVYEQLSDFMLSELYLPGGR
jgi:CBS domain-containing protein